MVNKVTKQYNTVLSQAKKGVPGFANAYAKFIEKVTIGQNSKSLIVNYSRSLAYISLHFNRPPQVVSVDEINAYLYSMMVHQNCSVTYFKHAVYALRYWFRLFDMEDKAIQMPPIKKETKLPVVLSRQECKELFKAPRTLGTQLPAGLCLCMRLADERAAAYKDKRCGCAAYAGAHTAWQRAQTTLRW